MIEQWRQVPGVSPAYEVSDLGRVRSLKRYAGTNLRVLATPLDSRGRPSVCIDRKARRVHQLVALAFLGPRPEGMEVRHLDGDMTNNRLSNLAYGTHAENIADQVRHGTHHMATRTHCPKGHEYTPENTLTWKSSRTCRECGRKRSRAWKAKRAAVAA